MSNLKVLWIEDNADTDLYHLTSPVYIDGRCNLDLAVNASEAFHYLNRRHYDIIIVDIRIPPGQNAEWKRRYQDMTKNQKTNSNRLGLELLRCIFDEKEPKPTLKIDHNLRRERYGVFTVEQREEIISELSNLNMGNIKYRRKNAMMPHTALLDFILEIAASLN
ncbi:MAG: hypothetical protein AAFZ15_28225 [Bacteroidota bacterium]